MLYKNTGNYILALTILTDMNVRRSPYPGAHPSHQSPDQSANQLPTEEPISPWIERWSHLLPPQSSVLDVACGRGRNSMWFARKGHLVWAIDQVAQLTPPVPTGINFVLADIESGPWPLCDTKDPSNLRQFEAVIVTNYLWRPLFPTLLASLKPGGVLLYETFAEGNAAFGRPARPDFLLQPGELLRHCNTLHTIAYENGLIKSADGTPQKIVQRIAAVRLASPDPASGADSHFAL